MQTLLKTPLYERHVALGARLVPFAGWEMPVQYEGVMPEPHAISAGLGWVCALDKDFTGADELRRIKEAGPERRLAAFVMEEAGIARQGMAIAEGGEVTSGSYSPCLLYTS